MPDRHRHIRLGRLLAAVVGVLAVGVVWAGLAWACTARAELDALDTVAGPAGTELTVSGHYLPAGGRAEVRLGSADGRLLAARAVEDTGDGYGRFSAKIKIPELPPDVYSIIAFGYSAPDEKSPEGKLEGNSPPRTFEVVPEGDNGGSPQPEPQEETAPGGDAGSGPGIPQGTIFAPGERGAPRSGGNNPPPRPDGEGLVSRPDRDPSEAAPATGPPPSASPPVRALAPGAPPPTGGSASGDTSSNGGASNGGARREGSGDLGLVTGPSGQPLFRDSLPSPALTDGRRAFGQPSGRSAAGDLWSGFGSGQMPSLEPRRGDPPAEDAGGFDIGMAAGTGFLGLGLVALFGSFLVAEVRRRRKAVRA